MRADPVGGEAARRAAQQELRKRIYHRDDPGLLSRAVHWLGRRFDWLLGGSPGGSALIILVVLVAAVVIFALARAGPPRRVARRTAAELDRDGRLSAVDHRELAEQFGAAGRLADALREWLRVGVATLEERSLLDPRPGRTAAEIARLGGSAIPAAAAPLQAAARVFDEVWFGGRPATSADVDIARGAADAVRLARSEPVDAAATGYAVPR